MTWILGVMTTVVRLDTAGPGARQSRHGGASGGDSDAKERANRPAGRAGADLWLSAGVFAGTNRSTDPRASEWCRN